MLLHTLRLVDYRNYQSASIELSPGMTLVTGANAQGKTNLLEGIYYLSIGKAYRQSRDEQIVRWGTHSFSIEAYAQSRQGNTKIQIQYNTKEKPAKQIFLDGLRRDTWEECSGVFTSVLFSPESMSVIKGPPQERRSFLDHDISQVSQSYGVDLLRYRRLLAQRNTLLKSIGHQKGLPGQWKEKLTIWDEQLIAYGSRIINKRLGFLEKMTPMARLMQRKLTEGKENLELHYLHAEDKYLSPQLGKATTSGTKRDTEASLTLAREYALEDDLRYGSTQWGPHRDDVRILLDDTDVRQFGSQGQQRTGVLALKLAEIEVFRGESGEYPILLLDDVLSELDEQRQDQLLSIINEKSIQCVITSTGDRTMDSLPNKQIKQLRVHQGEIREI